MNKVGFSEEEKANIFKVIAAVLHVGNIAFEDSGNKDGKCDNLNLSPHLTSLRSVVHKASTLLCQSVLSHTLAHCYLETCIWFQ